jgi:DNA-binding response OmpR family regulator
MEPLRHTFVVRFGTYEVSFQSGEVRKAGVKLLEALLERPGEVVTREELRSRVWPNESFGDFDQAVNIAIAKLRNPGVLIRPAFDPLRSDPRFQHLVQRVGLPG